MQCVGLELDAIRPRGRGDGGRGGARARRQKRAGRFRKAYARLGLGPVAVLVLGSSGEATHEVDHRYLVLGYVRNEANRPLPRRDVRLVRAKTGLAYGHLKQ